MRTRAIAFLERAPQVAQRVKGQLEPPPLQEQEFTCALNIARAQASRQLEKRVLGAAGIGVAGA